MIALTLQRLDVMRRGYVRFSPSVLCHPCVTLNEICNTKAGNPLSACLARGKEGCDQGVDVDLCPGLGMWFRVWETGCRNGMWISG